MKRLKGLWPAVIDFGNLLTAHHKARRGKRARDEVARFELDLEYELAALQAALAAQRWQPSPYREFHIYDRKPRLISAAPYADRVVHHALMNVVEPLLDGRFIHDCYACRPGRGVHTAVERYQHWARRYAYALKLDVVRYFPSIDHDRLLAKLARRIADRDVLQLFERIVRSAPLRPVVPGPGEDLVGAMARRTGLPIGNLTSQFLANLYLDDLDHYVRETLRVPAYLRYVDDLILLADDKAQLRVAAAAIAGHLAADHLRLHARPTQAVPTAAGLDVLGYRVWPDRRRLRPENGYRFRRRLRALSRAYARGELAWSDITPRVAAWIGHAEHGDTAGLRRELFAGIIFRRDEGVESEASDSRRVVEQRTAEPAFGVPQQERPR